MRRSKYASRKDMSKHHRESFLIVPSQDDIINLYNRQLELDAKNMAKNFHVDDSQ